jgi:heme exporter protein D
MMPDLGSYAVYVLSAWGATLALLAALILLTLRRNAAVKRALDEIEARRDAARAAPPDTKADPHGQA